MVFDKIKQMLGLGGNDTVAEQEEVEFEEEEEDPEVVEDGEEEYEEVNRD